MGVFKSAPYAHVSMANFTNVTAAVALRKQLFQAFSGLSPASFVQADNGQFSAAYPTKFVANIAVGLGLNNPQGAVAYYFYKKGVSAPCTATSTTPALFLYQQIKAIQATSSLEIEGAPVVLKA